MDNRWLLKHYSTMPVPEAWKPFIDADTSPEEQEPTRRRVAEAGQGSTLLTGGSLPERNGPMAVKPFADGKNDAGWNKNKSRSPSATADAVSSAEPHPAVQGKAKPFDQPATPSSSQENPDGSAASPKDQASEQHFSQYVDKTAGLLNILFPEGGAQKMRSLARDMVKVRDEYQLQAERIAEGVELRKRQGMSAEEIARWAFAERNGIKYAARAHMDLPDRLPLYARDMKEQNRNFEELFNKKVDKNPNLSNQEHHESIQKSASRPNTEVTKAVQDSEIILDKAGKILMPLALSATAFNLMTASEEDLPKVIASESGSWIGGMVGAGVAVSASILFWPVTAGTAATAALLGGGSLAATALGSFAGSTLAEKGYDFLFSLEGGGHSTLSLKEREKVFAEHEYQGP
ncbi:hypothetical protein [Insolitispirillum peregrinum]|uniref:Uncharacterized protein n=1 Tax=Insolitispirillum peregrinum TaxID=80876 RepID=A0A1N7LA58_9PROT|nr:hypothetical protein [Insolitispirillum peregrinum]SIS70600.1 hypothetical protein SAMN05421779_103195 [Insolitispirillum peregrinum]